jgi:sodium/potassium-transporting ATPase subunit alpha
MKRNGLDSGEAQRRILTYGRNELRKSKRRSILIELLGQFTHLFAVMLWIAAALAWLSNRLAPDQEMRLMAVAIVAVIIINGIFSFWQEFRAERILDALSKLLPHCALTLRSGKWTEIATEELVPEDIVSISTGDSVPADCRVLEATGLRVNSAAITGEALPESKNATDRNQILAGTLMVAGKAVAEVTATGMQTEFGKIAKLAQSAQETEAPLQREVRKLSYILGSLATVVGAIFFLIGRSAGHLSERAKIPHLYPDLKRPGACALSRVLAFWDAACAQCSSDSLDRSGNQCALRACPGSREA